MDEDNRNTHHVLAQASRAGRERMGGELPMAATLSSCWSAESTRRAQSKDGPRPSVGIEKLLVQFGRRQVP